MESHDDLLDPDWERPRRVNGLTVALVAALFVCGFVGGVLTERALTPDAPTMVTSGAGGAGPGGGVRRVGPGAP